MIILDVNDFLILAEKYRRCVCGGIFIGEKTLVCTKCGLRLVDRYGD